ncbi:MAG TPA: PAS domain S-box protein [Longimicrobiales bacterium]|nr:PAS domain S-box protein [Longimicrobiales bacterium]
MERGTTDGPLTESALEQALAAAPAVVYMGSLADGRFHPTWVSANIQTILGFTREQALAAGWWKTHVHPDDVQLDWVREARRRPEGRWDGHYRFIRADGCEIWIHEQVKWEPGPDIHTTRVVGSWMDVTSSRHREEALADSEERFRQLVTHIPQVFWINAYKGELLYVSPSYEEVWGRSQAELYERRSSWRESLHPEDRDRVAHFLATHGASEYEITYRIQRPDGEVRWIRDRGFPVPDSTGRVYRMAGIAEDITERVLATQRVEAAEQHYRRLITTSPYAVYTMDVNGVFTELNPAAEVLLGSPASVLLGRSFLEIIAPDSRDRAADAFQRMLTGETDDVAIQLVVLTPDGDRRVLSVAATTMRDRGVVEGMHGIARDITHEVERDQRIRMLAEALDRLPDAVCIERDDGSILYSNDAFQELTATRTRSEVTGLQALLAENTSARERRAVRDELVNDGAWRGRTSIPRGDTTVPLEIVARRIELGLHQVTILLARDVTEQVERELQLRRTERLASLGTLVGGVAHELNNPLTAIAGFVELMLAEERSADDRDALETLRRETARVAKIVSDLRLLARESQDVQNRRLQPIDVNDIIQHVLRVRRYALDTSNIEVRANLEKNLPLARGVPSEIEQVVLNLVVNASHALDMSDRQEKVLTINSAATRAGVAFEVIDNGSGIPESVVEHIFDPFFTTKSPGEGTGLGLSLVHSIVSEHGGRISVNSIEGRGSAFSVLLPFAREVDATSTPPQPPAQPPCTQPLRVLIVDDEAAIRLALVRHLERRGHTVETAEDGAAALEQIAASGFDVILSDIRMPGMSGDRLLRELRERGSEEAIRRLVFMTGDPASEAVQQGVEHAIPVLSKPFTLREITEKIEEHAASSRN